MSSLEEAQRALSAGRFDDARRGFAAALEEDPTAEAHEGLAWAAIWLDDVVTGVDSFESAHRLYLARDDRRGAGRLALWLAYSHGYIRGQPAVAAGWGERASRLLDGLSPGPEHVWLAIATAAARHGSDSAEARRLVREAAGIARRLGRPDLEAMGIASEGLVLVYAGNVDVGMRLLDEAAVAAIASGSADFAAVGHACCAMLAACELAGDIGRASEWCERTSEYADRYGFRPLQATCRTHYAGVLMWSGRWAEAEAELVRADREFARARPASQGDAIVRLAELRRRQGRFAVAAELLAQVEGRAAAVFALAGLAVDVGETERARDLAERCLRQIPSSECMGRALALELLLRTCAELADIAAAEQAHDDLRAIAETAPSEAIQAVLARAAGRLAAAHAAPESARRCFEDAVDLFARCGAPYESAWARFELARSLEALGRTADAHDEARAARAVFERLGAGHGVDLVTSFLGANEAEAVPATDLTARELEVLRLLAGGLSNRQLATQLVISEHTVHRHVTNLYRKLHVSSRSAATAYAHRHGLV